MCGGAVINNLTDVLAIDACAIAASLVSVSVAMLAPTVLVVEFATSISCGVINILIQAMFGVLSGAKYCVVTSIGVDRLTAVNANFLTDLITPFEFTMLIPLEELIPVC